MSLGSARWLERGGAAASRFITPLLPSGQAASYGINTAASRRELPGQLRPATDAPHPPDCSRTLRRAGLLNDTIVLWGGEFGRTPTAESSDGREHHPFGFSMWLAGGGFKAGLAYGRRLISDGTPLIKKFTFTTFMLRFFTKWASTTRS